MPHSKSFSSLLIVALATAAGSAHGQENPMPSAGALKVELARLGTTARVLYVAAHPDDENTRLLTYFANQRHLDVAYLSLTRGGGGQNLIGPEQAELLAAIRTQELLAARRTDGARQFFSRARDFGYSKTPKEALGKWGRQSILSDVVWVIRAFRPDVIVTRFRPDGRSHGHHTASAQLAIEAFDAARDPSRFPEHLEHGVTPWAPHRVAINVPIWRRTNEDVSGYLAIDVGGYDPRLGASYGEIAARSRTNHKSQGFGSSGRRGPIMEYFETVGGSEATTDLLDGVVLDWGRFEGGEKVAAALGEANLAFDVEAPERIVPGLLKARTALTEIAKRRPVPRIFEGIEDIDRLITRALGLYTQAAADRPEVSAGDAVKVNLEVVLRRPSALKLTETEWPDGRDTDEKPIKPHTPHVDERDLRVPSTTGLSVQHWLSAPLSADTYPVPEPSRVADPESPPAMFVVLHFDLGGTPWARRVPVTYRWTDNVLGERRRPVLVVPPLMVTPDANVSMFPGGGTREVYVVARAGRAGAEGVVRLGLPRTWKSDPPEHDVKLQKVGDEAKLRFMVTPPNAQAAPLYVQPYAQVGRKQYRMRFDVIDYPHLPVQALLRPTRVRLVPVDFIPPAVRVGYIAGSGDSVAANLRAVGMNVETIDTATLKAGDFGGFDAILLGVRAFNVRADDLRAAHPALMNWVESGGRLVVQYNTSNRWRKLTDPVGPFPFTINRGRVTDETAPVKVLVPDHPIFNRPHKIEATDFSGWVQERGLYFAETWDERYTPLLSLHDPDEEPLKGSLLFTPHGKGAFVYTGLSFFRQLPAGVPGAYRLVANMLSGDAAVGTGK